MPFAPKGEDLFELGGRLLAAVFTPCVAFKFCGHVERRRAERKELGMAGAATELTICDRCENRDPQKQIVLANS